MGRALRSPGGGGGGPVTVSDAQKAELAEKIIKNSGSKLSKRLERAMTVEQFFDIYNDEVQKAENRFKSWSAKGLVDDIPLKELEQRILGEASDKVMEALGEAMALRIGYAYRRLIMGLRLTGGKWGKDLTKIVDELAGGHGDVKKLLRDPAMRVADHESILASLSEEEIGVINWASKAKVVGRVITIPEPFFEPGVIRGPLRWSVRKMLETKVIKDPLVKVLNIERIIRSPAEHAQTLETFGLYLDKHPNLKTFLNKTTRAYKVGGLLVGLYLLKSCVEDNEEEASEGTKAAGAKMEAKNKEVQGILWSATEGGRMDPYLKKNSVVITNIIDSATVMDEVETDAGEKVMKNRPLTQEEKKRIASILLSFMTSPTIDKEKKKAFMDRANKKAITEVLAVLLRSEAKATKAQLGELAVDIAMGVSEGQRIEFAWDLINSKEAKKGDLRYFYENPPGKYKMTMEWLGRPFDVFQTIKLQRGRRTIVGFTPNENLKMLCAAIRSWGRSSSETGMQITDTQMEQLADAMANVYLLLSEKRASGARPTVPAEFQGHLEFMADLISKGFSISKAGTILYSLEYSYQERYSRLERMGGQIFDPLQDDKGRKDVIEMLIPNLKPEMSEEDLYYRTQSLAYLETGAGSKEFKRELNPNLRAAFGDKIAAMLARDPRIGFAKGTQSMELAKESGEVFRAVSRIWKSSESKYDDTQILATAPYVITAADSKSLGKLSEAEKAELLYTIFSETAESEVVRLSIATTPKSRGKIDSRTLPLSVKLDEPAARQGKVGKRDKKMMATLRAVALRHAERYAASKKEVTIDEMREEMTAYIDFVRANYSGNKYVAFDSIESAFDKQRPKL